ALGVAILLIILRNRAEGQNKGNILPDSKPKLFILEFISLDFEPYDLWAGADVLPDMFTHTYFNKFINYLKETNIFDVKHIYKQSRQVTAEEINNTLEKVEKQSNKDDILLFFISTHGAYVKDRQSTILYMTNAKVMNDKLSYEAIIRNDLVKKLKKLPMRFKILLTNNCNAPIRTYANIKKFQAYNNNNFTEINLDDIKIKNFDVILLYYKNQSEPEFNLKSFRNRVKNIFLNYKGFLDVETSDYTQSRYDSYAWATHMGAIHPFYFFEAIYNEKVRKEFFNNKNDLTWKDIFKYSFKRTNSITFTSFHYAKQFPVLHEEPKKIS
ncbi:MAG: caspase family protein, partial [Spirochaetota bacterium]